MSVVCVSLSLVLNACTAVPGNDPRLTPAQNELRQTNARWNQTVATGAVAGAATGAVAGAALSRNRGRGALIGAGVGLVGGVVAGAVVANRNHTFTDRSASAQSRIENATMTANALEAQAGAAQQVVAQNRIDLANLDRQYRARQVSAAEYRERTETARADLVQMNQGVQNGAAAREQINRVSGDMPELRVEENRIGPAQRRLEASANDLEEMLRRVPA